MRVWSKTTLRSLFLPGGVVLAGVVVLVYSGWLTLALPALTFLYYSAVIGGMLLAWRFHSSRVFLSLLMLFLAEQGIALLGSSSAFRVFPAIAVLVPLNFIFIALMHERGISTESVAPVSLLLFVQFVTVAVFAGSAQKGSPIHVRHAAAATEVPVYVVTIVVVAAVLLLGRFLLTRKPADSALSWSLAAAFLALQTRTTARTSMVYWATAAGILGASIIENSYLLAYHDELTTLPSRRAFNDGMMRLKAPYSIAVVDIDHFKRFNDTYGHETGDQVLRLVAGNLSRVTGGGQAYRCGGEEFNILFPGRTTAEVISHLEQLRTAIASSEFRMRGTDRRSMPRGVERRTGQSRGRVRKGQVIRELAKDQSAAGLSVTVSIGVATATREGTDPEAILQAADKALYRAKENGRNRVETASSSKARGARAAGIA